MGRDYMRMWITGATSLTNSMVVLRPRQRKETPGAALRHAREVADLRKNKLTRTCTSVKAGPTVPQSEEAEEARD